MKGEPKKLFDYLYLVNGTLASLVAILCCVFWEYFYVYGWFDTNSAMVLYSWFLILLSVSTLIVTCLCFFVRSLRLPSIFFFISMIILGIYKAEQLWIIPSILFLITSVVAVMDYLQRKKQIKIPHHG
ncbi:hypothetical protein [Marininema halotolerans]|uniref:Uncharacterized protein n=1 Tax=Marininema halotolerans TaxID=1155944 RepID=A0A1I6T0D7_9BACL|nr:hypothetical protein [Marininema halotolerans]SFS82704.1 hypothetical protein SAMN05444972_108176 [Marininema halotolerans]